MAIYKNYKIAKARKVGELLGREGVSDHVIKAIEGWDGSCKGAMELCGKLTLWADVSTFDDYWQEQVQRGIEKECSIACDLISTLNKQ
jgi:hypothetical protein